MNQRADQTTKLLIFKAHTHYNNLAVDATGDIEQWAPSIRDQNSVKGMVGQLEKTSVEKSW